MCVLWSEPARAAPEERVSGEESVSSEEEMQQEMARIEEMARAIERALGIFIVHEERREVIEGVVVRGSEAEVWYLRPLEVSQEKAKCDAYRWLLLGRLSDATGVGPVFEAYPGLEQVTLVFYDVETKVRGDGRGGYRQSRSAVRHLEVTLSRERSRVLDPKGLRRALGGEGGECVEAGQSLVNRYWYIR